MRKKLLFFRTTVLLLFVFLGWNTSWGQILLTDDFTGLTTSNLATQSSWTKGGTGPDATVQNTIPLTYNGYNGGGGEYAQMSTANSTTSRVYKGFTATTAVGNTFYVSFF